MLYLLLLALVGSIAADSCDSCTQSNGQWCGDVGSNAACNAVTGCKNIIKNPLNCPRYPDPKYAYSDSFTRNYVFPFIGAVYADPNSAACMKNALPTATFYKNIIVPCGSGNESCTVLTGYDASKQVIIVSFAGTESGRQLGDELASFFYAKQSFFGVGNVFSYFYKAFYDLWNGGLESAVRSLQYLYPNYKLVATGHSMGASIGTVFASHVVKVNLWQPSDIQLVTFGQPRTGDKNFSMWHDNTFPYSYRVVHHRDLVPHIPPMGTPDEVFHHRYEVWYNNKMAAGANYTICAEADGPYCSNTVIDYSTADHVDYFNIDMGVYIDSNCVKTR